jgi:hypothetical protein
MYDCETKAWYRSSGDCCGEPDFNGNPHDTLPPASRHAHRRISRNGLLICGGIDALRLAREESNVHDGKSLGIGLVPNRMQRTRLGADLLTALVTMGEKVLPPIGNRSLVAESASVGLTCREASPKSPAAQEFAALAVGVEGMIAA